MSDELDSSDSDNLDKHLLVAAKVKVERECEEEEGKGDCKHEGENGKKKNGKFVVTSKTLILNPHT